MKKLLLKLKKKNNAKLNLLLILVLLFSVGFGCKFNTGSKTDADDTKTEKTKNDDDDSKEDSDDKNKKVEKADASTGEVPSDEQVQALVKETMLDFSSAVKDKDFSDFYDTISETWQKQIKPKDLEKGFKVFIDNNITFSEISSMKADFDGSPEVKKKSGVDVLSVKGSYDTSPRNVKFDLEYIPEGKDWKLFAIQVSTK